MSRKNIIDSNEVRRMAEIGCTLDEMCQKFGVTTEVILNNYREEYEQGIVALHELIRKTQIDCALGGDGDSTMLIFLGKAILKQTEANTEKNMADLDVMLTHLERQAKCSNYLVNNFKASENPTQE